MKKQYHGVDCLKFVCAALIILLHVPPVSSKSVFYLLFREIICIIAVPAFFAMSGFLVSSHLNDQQLPVAAKKNYKHYIVWSIIYFPFVSLGVYIRSIAEGKVLSKKALIFAKIATGAISLTGKTTAQFIDMIKTKFKL